MPEDPARARSRDEGSRRLGTGERKLRPRELGSAPSQGGGRRAWLATAVKGTVAAAILVFLFTRVSVADVVGALVSARTPPLLAAVGLSFLAQVAAAYRLRTLAAAHGFGFSTARMLEINLGAMFYGLFVPGGNVTAGAVRLYKMARDEGRLPVAFSALLRDRLDATVALAVVGLGFFLVDRPPGAGAARLALWAGLGGCLLLWLVLFHPRVARWVSGWVARIPVGMLRRPLAKLWGALETAAGIRAALQAKAFSISVSAQLLGVGSYVLLARAVDVDVSASALGWIRSAVIFITMVPVSIGGIGLREGAFLFFLAPYGVGEERVLALSFLAFAATVVVFGAAGGLLEAMDALAGRRDRERSPRANR